MSSPRPTPAFVLEPLPDLEAWTDYLLAAEVPVLAETAEVLELLRNNEDDVDAHRIGEAVSGDPLMTLKVLAWASRHQGRRVVTDVETVTEALVLMGISPFFRAFGAQPTVGDWLDARPEASTALLSLIARAHHGAKLALAFAVQRMDPDASIVYAVALLREFADMLLWCHAPTLQLQIQQLQEADHTLRSRAAQEQVLHIAVADLQVELARHWHLSELLAPTEAARHTEVGRIRSVELAARLARHVRRGWDSVAVSDDIAELALLLNLSIPATRELAQSV